MSAEDTQARASRAHDGWIGQRPSAARIAAFLAVGSIALIMAGVQPVVLGGLVTAGRLDVSQLGWSVTIEFLAIGVGVGLADALLPPRRLKLIGLTAALVLAAINFAAFEVSGLGVVVTRGLAGLAEGAIVWLTTLMIVRSPTPGRWSGVFLVSQAVLQVACAAGIPILVSPALGANAGFATLGASAALAGIIALVLPDRLAPLAGNRSDEPVLAEPIPKAAYVSLAAVFLIFSFFIGFLAYVERLAGQAGLTPVQGGLAVALALGASIAGSGLAAVLADKIAYHRALLVCAPIFLAVLVGLWGLPGSGVFFVLAGLHGLAWGFLQALQAPFVIESDPSRRAVLLAPSVQAVGAAAGPMLCSFFVTVQDARGVLVASGACLALSFVLAIALWVSRRRRQARSALAVV
ncbi:MFS transporter [Caulobacter sp. SSI4214]|uniref:MFS transporter n=1 Tax=Caulobacter sp. SSI4214 TaxID=2575739 RepID=UPI00143CB33F|nr:MFS transporter [Caulobacter sp. SSI4214]